MQSASVQPVVQGVVVDQIPPQTTRADGAKPPPPEPPLLTAAQAQGALQPYGFPAGVASMMHASLSAFPLRIWIVDNSGSMIHPDGERVAGSGAKQKMLSCTRWQELSQTVTMQGHVSAALGVRTDFCLLNPGSEGQRLSLNADKGATYIPPLGPPGDVTDLQRLLSTSPNGTTPLTRAVQDVIRAVAPAAETLRERGQQVVVVVATDGLPDHQQSFVAAIKELQRYPVFVIVRLCTNDERVAEYWGELDAVLEAPLEVLDDVAGEAEEVVSKNRWLNYGLPLHHAREFGMRDKLFDLIDETSLLPSQIKQLVEMILDVSELTEPELDPRAFFEELRRVQQEAQPVFNVLTKKVQPWVNEASLKQALRAFERGSRTARGSADGSAGCGIM